MQKNWGGPEDEEEDEFLPVPHQQVPSPLAPPTSAQGSMAYTQSHFQSCQMGPASGGQFVPKNSPSMLQHPGAGVMGNTSAPQDNLAVLEQQLLAQAESGSVEAVQQLMQLEMLREMRRSRGKGSGGHGGDDSDEDDAEFPNRKGSLKGLENLRKRFHSRPDSITETYMSRVLQNLGVNDPRQVWKLTEFSKKIKPQFGRMTGIWRCHHATCEILQMLIDGHHKHATAMCVQLLKAQHQAAINQGSWEIASMMLPTEDPLARIEFGGDHEEMQRIQSYRRGLRDLRTNASRGIGPEEEPDGEAKPKKGGKNRGRGKKKDEEA